MPAKYEFIFSLTQLAKYSELFFHEPKYPRKEIRYLVKVFIKRIFGIFCFVFCFSIGSEIDGFWKDQLRG